jgi:hypothetical protein
VNVRRPAHVCRGTLEMGNAGSGWNSGPGNCQARRLLVHSLFEGSRTLLACACSCSLQAKNSWHCRYDAPTKVALPFNIVGLVAFELFAMHFVETKRGLDFRKPGSQVIIHQDPTSIIRAKGHSLSWAYMHGVYSPQMHCRDEASAMFASHNFLKKKTQPRFPVTLTRISF